MISLVIEISSPSYVKKSPVVTSKKDIPNSLSTYTLAKKLFFFISSVLSLNVTPGVIISVTPLLTIFFVETSVRTSILRHREQF